MADQILVGGFSKARPGFTSKEIEDSTLFETENKGVYSLMLELSTKMLLEHLFRQHFKYSFLQKFQGGLSLGDFSIMAIDPKLIDDMSLFLAVTSIAEYEQDELDKAKKEVEAIYEKAKKAIEQYGDKACMLIC
ncbi:MAG: hypothetical protein KBC17_00580 [Candidatus Pacebacteria bacterium]|nr:hypothetical protein [Candidatus Paceibacterota bacterium]